MLVTLFIAACSATADESWPAGTETTQPVPASGGEDPEPIDRGDGAHGDQPAPTQAISSDQPITASRREQSQAIAECAANEGIAVEVDPGGDGVTWRAPEGQENLYDDVIDRCAESVAEAYGVAQGEPTVEDLERWYLAYLWTHDCMKGEGYPVEDPPSLDVFLDSQGTIWHPYNAVVRSAGGEIKPGVQFSEEAFRELENTCPQDVTYLLKELNL